MSGPIEIEPVTALTPRPVQRALIGQRWLDLCFLHWVVDPAEVAPLLPGGTRPDTLDGATYVGLIGFRMVGLGLGRAPGIPWVGTFLETNVRLYSVDERGRRAVVFRSLDATRLISVLTGQVGLGLPYKWSRMGFARTSGRAVGDPRGSELTYTCRRRWPGPSGAASRMRIRVGDPVVAGPVEHFLTARWGLHTRVGRHTVHLPNEHDAWPLWSAELLACDDELVAAAGLAVSGPPVSVLYSPGVPVAFGGPDRLP